MFVFMDARLNERSLVDISSSYFVLVQTWTNLALTLVKVSSHHKGAHNIFL
jgi:hypothetical protein